MSAIVRDFCIIGTSLPAQATHAGQFLTTDGTNASWAAVTVPTAASPSGTINSTVGSFTNGVATTFMRSDGAPTLPTTIAGLNDIKSAAGTALTLGTGTTGVALTLVSANNHLLTGGQTTDGALAGMIQVPSTATGGLVIYNTADVTTNYEALQITFVGNDARIDTRRAGGGLARQLILGIGGNNAFIVNTNLSISLQGLVNKYNNTNTAGYGNPAVYGSARSLAQTGDVASVATYTNTASDGTFIVSCNILVTIFAAGTQAAKVTYTDESNVARTLVLNTSTIAGVFATTVAATGAFEGVPVMIRVKASTAITILTVGTAWNGTYNVEGLITQVA